MTHKCTDHLQIYIYIISTFEHHRRKAPEPDPMLMISTGELKDHEIVSDSLGIMRTHTNEGDFSLSAAAALDLFTVFICKSQTLFISTEVY